ncbi:MAG: hypothetical protein Kow0081_1210 [Candidatus Dojkabacteria bacterium]
MKTLQNFFKISVFILLLILVGIWAPWGDLDISIAPLFGVETSGAISGLQVYSLAGTIEVYVEDELKGMASVDTPLFVAPIEPGKKKVSLKRPSAIQGSYTKVDEIIDFTEGIDVVITYGIGPSDFYSQGSIITTRKRTNEAYNLEVSTNVDSPEIFIDNIRQDFSGNRLVTLISLNKQSEIRIEKDGYEPLSFTLLPEDQAERDIFQNYIIHVEARLMLQPVDIR